MPANSSGLIIKKPWHNLEDQRATPQFLAAAEKFLHDYGLPEDWRGLMLFLDYPDSPVVAEALQRLQQLAPSQSMTELQGLKGKLRTLSLTSRFLEVKEAGSSHAGGDLTGWPATLVSPSPATLIWITIQV